MYKSSLTQANDRFIFIFASSLTLYLQTSKKKGFEIPECRYGVACARKDCVYKHPTRPAKPKQKPTIDASIEVCMPYLAGCCHFGPHCTSRHPSQDEIGHIKTKLAKKMCRFGADCRTQHCLYQHPVDLNEANTLPGNGRSLSSEALARELSAEGDLLCDESVDITVLTPQGSTAESLAPIVSLLDFGDEEENVSILEKRSKTVVASGPVYRANSAGNMVGDSQWGSGASASIVGPGTSVGAVGSCLERASSSAYSTEAKSELQRLVDSDGKPSRQFVAGAIPNILLQSFDSDFGRDCFSIADPMERFRAVNQRHNRAMENHSNLKVIDLHYQSVSSVVSVLDRLWHAHMRFLEECDADAGYYLPSGPGALDSGILPNGPSAYEAQLSSYVFGGATGANVYDSVSLFKFEDDEDAEHEAQEKPFSKHDRYLPYESLNEGKSVIYVLSGTGSHVPGATHQKSGGVLFKAVARYLLNNADFDSVRIRIGDGFFELTSRKSAG